MVTINSDKKLNQEVFSLILNLDSGPILLDSKDIIECYFIEDIFSYCMSGKLIFNDFYGISEFGPLTSNETLKISYGVEADRELIFNIWKMGKIVQKSPTDPTGELEIEIIFVDQTLESLIMQKFSRSWQQEKISSIMKHIFTKMVGVNQKYIDIEETSNKIDFIMPYWTPMQSLKYLMKRARSKDEKTSGYLCYNNTKNGSSINIKTLNHLFSNNNEIDDIIYSFEDKVEIKNNKIYEFWINSLDRFSNKYIRGGHWKGYDFMTKTFIDKTFDYSDGIKNTNILGQKSLYTDISSLTTGNVILGLNDEEIMENIIYDGWCKRYNMQQVLNLIMIGHEDRYCGQQIEISWPSADRREGIFNKQLRGKWLIKSITHNLIGQQTNIAYRQRIVLLKNSFEDSDMKTLVNGNKKRVNLYSDINKNKIGI